MQPAPPSVVKSALGCTKPVVRCSALVVGYSMPRPALALRGVHFPLHLKRGVNSALWLLWRLTAGRGAQRALPYTCYTLEKFASR